MISTLAKPVSRRRKSYRLWLTGVCFALLLVLPVLDQVLSLSAGFRSTEKRVLTPLPTFQFPHVRTYIAGFNQYYKENFGWRNALFYQYSRWKYRMMNVSPLPDKVVVGRNGWFYPGNTLANVADQHRGFFALDSVRLRAIAARLTTYQRQLAGQGTRLYVFIAPDSYSIYPEHVPGSFKLTPGPSNFDRIKQYLSQHSTIPFVDCRSDLIRAKSAYVVYRQTDTHWNDCGSLVASLSLVNRLRRDFPTIPAVHLASYRIRAVAGGGGDLVTMLALNRDIVDSVEYRITPPAPLRAKETERTVRSESGLPDQRFANPDSTRPKLLLLGDSFTYSMNQFVPGYFRETYVIRASHLDSAEISREKPDVLVVEIAERNLGSLSDL